MTDFLNRPLGAVSRIFRFFNGDAQRSAVDLSGALQPVYDYSRQAEREARGGQGTSGYLELGQTLVEVGAATGFASTDPYASFNSIGQLIDFDSNGRRRDRLWLMGLFASSNTSNFTIATSGINFEAVTPSRILVLAQWDVRAAAMVSMQDEGLMVLAASPKVMPADSWFPFFLAPGDLWVSSATLAGAGTTRIHSRWWAGPEGTTPPGMM